MASITMTASFLGGTVRSSAASPQTTHRRFVITNAASNKDVKISCESDRKEEGSNGRRDLMFTAAAAAVCSVVGIASAAEPKRGSPEAKKAYSAVCVSMPTARICRN